MQTSEDYFELYLKNYPLSPSLVLVRSVEAKNFPYQYLKEPILDLCCGDGFFAKVIRLDSYKQVVGCDINEIDLRVAKDRGVYSEVKLEDARKLNSFSNSFFNTVISNCALEHVDGISNAIWAISRVLSRGGHLIMTVPSELLLDCFPLKKIFESIGIEKWGEKLLDIYNKKQAHRNILSLNQWERLLNEAGLKILRHFYLFDESSYKIAILLDWLPTLKVFSIINRLFDFVIPRWVRKAFLRRLLKRIYVKSAPFRKRWRISNNSNK